MVTDKLKGKQSLALIIAGLPKSMKATKPDPKSKEPVVDKQAIADDVMKALKSSDSAALSAALSSFVRACNT